ncbi:unnamed protein product, partial [Trichogramma brassicae]
MHLGAAVSNYSSSSSNRASNGTGWPGNRDIKSTQPCDASAWQHGATRAQFAQTRTRERTLYTRAVSKSNGRATAAISIGHEKLEALNPFLRRTSLYSYRPHVEREAGTDHQCLIDDEQDARRYNSPAQLLQYIQYPRATPGRVYSCSYTPRSRGARRAAVEKSKRARRTRCLSTLSCNSTICSCYIRITDKYNIRAAARSVPYVRSTLFNYASQGFTRASCIYVCRACIRRLSREKCLDELVLRDLYICICLFICFAENALTRVSFEPNKARVYLQLLRGRSAATAAAVAAAPAVAECRLFYYRTDTDSSTLARLRLKRDFHQRHVLLSQFSRQTINSAPRLVYSLTFTASMIMSHSTIKQTATPAPAPTKFCPLFIPKCPLQYTSVYTCRGSHSMSPEQALHDLQAEGKNNTSLRAHYLYAYIYIRLCVYACLHIYELVRANLLESFCGPKLSRKLALSRGVSLSHRDNAWTRFAALVTFCEIAELEEEARAL